MSYAALKSERDQKFWNEAMKRLEGRATAAQNQSVEEAKQILVERGFTDEREQEAVMFVFQRYAWHVNTDHATQAVMELYRDQDRWDLLLAIESVAHRDKVNEQIRRTAAWLSDHLAEKLASDEVTAALLSVFPESRHDEVFKAVSTLTLRATQWNYDALREIADDIDGAAAVTSAASNGSTLPN